ncbi:hypothetical protein CY34DRAFT_98406, partial [Suillus luteus UH-Slu-Lm8-n1]
QILQLLPEYVMNVQARVPDVLCALHNFIRRYYPDTSDEEYAKDMLDYDHKEGGELNELDDGLADPQERWRADSCRDCIAREMWEDAVHAA